MGRGRLDLDGAEVESRELLGEIVDSLTESKVSDTSVTDEVTKGGAICEIGEVDELVSS